MESRPGNKAHPFLLNIVILHVNLFGQVAFELAEAYLAYDEEKMRELSKKLILPLSRLKSCGKEFVLEYGILTITAEIANDTDWLK